MTPTASMRSPAVPLRLFLAAIAVAVVLAPWWMAREESRESFPGFVVRPAVEKGDYLPLFAREEINPDSPEAKAHSATLVETSDGTLLAAWYAGSGEGAPDVTIQMSERGSDGKWSAPRVIFDRASVSALMRRHVLSLGNPVLLPGEDGRVGLLFVSISAGRWSGSSMNLSWSYDNGRTWSAPEKLTLNPMANLSALPRNPPSPLVGGGWAVPVYEEFIGRFPEVLWLRPRETARTAATSRMDDGMSVFQPSVAPLSTRRALALYREGGGVGRAFLARSEDYGRSWSAGEASVLPNVDSGVCMLRLPDGRLLCAINDSASRRRENLRLALSDDEGKSWRIIATLVEEAGQSFAYPYMILGRDGCVRMLYSAYGTRIVYTEFNIAWIDVQAAMAAEVMP